MEPRSRRQGVASAGDGSGKLIEAGGEAWTLYCCWRFGGENPAVRWRSLERDPTAPPEPWPERVDAFMVACSEVAGRRERDLLSALEGLAGGGK